MNITKTLLVLAALVITACGSPDHDPYKNPSNDGGLGNPGGPTQPATFEAVKTQLLDQHCTGCHGPGGRLMDLSTFEAVMSRPGLITPGDPQSSRMLQAIVEGSMPPRGAPPSADALALLTKWISEGAIKN